MKVWREPAEVPPAASGRAVTIGAFDGVHLGHVAVLRLVHDLARARELSATVLTFDRHPAEVVRPQSAPRLLTPLDQKLELLDATGTVDECLVLTFDAARSRESAEEFVEEVLSGVLSTRLVVVGADFHFGHRRHGDVPLLQRMGAELGFEVLGLGLVAAPDGTTPTPDALPYSSTRVRAVLADGDVAAAAEILGRPHEVRGELRDGAVAVAGRICLPAPGTYRVEVATPGSAVQGEVTVADDTDAPTRHVAVDASLLGGPVALRFLAPA